MSVGVKAALITACAVVVAAVVPFLHKESPTVTGSGIVATTSGANSPVIIASGDNPTVIQGADGTIVKNSLSDVAVAKDYDDKFEHMTKRRALAAIVVQEYLSKGKWSLVTNNTDALDDVLGFFDLMGYDQERGLLSPATLHEYFCDDIMSYYQVSKDYIADVQTKEGATTFEHIKPLFEVVRKIESEKTPKIKIDEVYFTKDELWKYFQSETNSVNLKVDK